MELGAAAIGSIVYFVMVMVGLGFNTGMQIMVARRVGEEKPAEVGRIFRHNIVILGIYTLIAFALLHYFGSYIIGLLISSRDVHLAAASFIEYRSYGIFFGLANACFLSLYIGLGWVKRASPITPR